MGLRRTLDPYDKAQHRAWGLLLDILPQTERERLNEFGVIQIEGKCGKYTLSPYSQTQIVRSGKTVAYACLQLSIPAPVYDRLIAEYLLIKNDEVSYWKTANVFNRTPDNFGVATLLMIAFVVALAVNLILQILFQ